MILSESSSEISASLSSPLATAFAGDPPAALSAAALYAGINAIWLVVLALGVVRVRMARKVGTGDGDQPELRNAIRAHGNAAEVIPTGIAMLILVALLGASPLFIHITGGLLTLSRVLHAASMWWDASKTSLARVLGTVLAFATLIALGAGAIWHAFV